MSSILANPSARTLGPEWANVSVSRNTFLPEDIFHSVAHLVPVVLKALFLQADEDQRACILFEDVFDALNRIAPAGCYCGPHVGNSSDFGFWELPSDEDELAAHQVNLDGVKRYFPYCRTTDTYGEELLPGDISLLHSPVSFSINTSDIAATLEGMGASQQVQEIRDYIVFLERIAGPILYP